MKNPDDSDEAIECMRKRAQFLIDGGMEREQALNEAIDSWGRSLLRAQMRKSFDDNLRSLGKPTLHVSLLEVARIR